MKPKDVEMEEHKIKPKRKDRELKNNNTIETKEKYQFAQENNKA